MICNFLSKSYFSSLSFLTKNIHFAPSPLAGPQTQSLELWRSHSGSQSPRSLNTDSGPHWPLPSPTSRKTAVSTLPMRRAQTPIEIWSHKTYQLNCLHNIDHPLRITIFWVFYFMLLCFFYFKGSILTRYWLESFKNWELLIGISPK